MLLIGGSNVVMKWQTFSNKIMRRDSMSFEIVLLYTYRVDALVQVTYKMFQILIIRHVFKIPH